MLAPALVAVLVGCSWGRSPDGDDAGRPGLVEGRPTYKPSTCWLRSGRRHPSRCVRSVCGPRTTAAVTCSTTAATSGRGSRVTATVKFDDRRVTGLTPLPWLPGPVRITVSPRCSRRWSMALQGQPPPPAPPRDTSGPPPETTQLIPDITRYRPDTRDDCRRCSLDYQQPALVSALGRFDADRRADAHERPGSVPRREGELPGGDARRAHHHGGGGCTRQNIRQAMADLPARLEAIACDPWLSTTEKRGILMALRDEMNASAEGRAAAAQVGEAPDALRKAQCAGTWEGSEPSRDQLQTARRLRDGMPVRR